MLFSFVLVVEYVECGVLMLIDFVVWFDGVCFVVLCWLGWECEL